jgi:hypothetical protein
MTEIAVIAGGAGAAFSHSPKFWKVFLRKTSISLYDGPAEATPSTYDTTPVCNLF